MDVFELQASIDVDISEFESKLKAAKKDGETFSKSLKGFGEEAAKIKGPMDDAGEKIQEILNDSERTSKSKAASIAAIYKKMGDDTSTAMKKAWSHIERGSADADKAIEGVSKSTKAFGDEANSTSRDVGKLGDETFLLGEIADTSSEKIKKGFSKLGGVIKGIVGGITVATTAAATGIATVVKSSVDSVASYEQLEGGVNKIFGSSAQSVMENAKQAYKTAGMSANEYMETVTGFSASLIQSLGGDTQKAVDIADTAIRDMSDNANTYGTDMMSIQNAYAGFSKQNYTMLDNLKLGYGGTKQEMERLLEDAEKLQAAQGNYVDYSIDSYADVVMAIHDVQENLSITGTTSKEAGSTIEGSMSSAKAAWDNFLSGAGSVDEFATSIKGAVVNIVDNLKEIVPRITSGLVEIVNAVAPEIPPILIELLPSILEAASGLVASVVKSLPTIIKTLVPAISGAIGTVLGSISGKLGDFWNNELYPELKNVAGYLGGKFKKIFENIKNLFDKNSGSLKGLADMFGTLYKAVKDGLKKVLDFTEWLTGSSKGAETLRDVIKGVAAGFLAYKTVMLAVSVAEKAQVAITEGLAAAHALLNSTNPFGWAALAIAGVTALTVVVAGLISDNNRYIKAEASLTDEQRKQLDEVNKLCDAYGKQKEARQEASEEIEKEHDRNSNLLTDLENIVDENGEIKKGYENRASVITGELSEALGIEIETVDGVIQKWDELKNKAEETIEVQRAQAYLESYKEDYMKAIDEQKELAMAQSEAIGVYTETEQSYKNAKELYEKAQAANYEEWWNELRTSKEYAKYADLDRDDALKQLEQDANNAGLAWSAAGVALKDIKQASEDSLALVQNYDSLGDAIASGNLENITYLTDSLKHNLKTSKTASYETLKKQNEDLKTELDNAKNALKLGLPGVTQEYVDNIQRMYNISLTETEKSKNIMTEGGTKSVENYALAFANGVTANTETVTDAMGGLTDEIIKKASNEEVLARFHETGSYWASGLAQGIIDGSYDVSQAGQGVVSDLVREAKDILQIRSPSKVAKEIGGFFTEGFAIGISDKTTDAVKSVRELVKSTVGGLDSSVIPSVGSVNTNSYMRGSSKDTEKATTVNYIFENVNINNDNDIETLSFKLEQSRRNAVAALGG